MSASREAMVSKPGSPEAISDAMNCRFASSHRTVVPASPLTCSTGGQRIEEQVLRAVLGQK
jgi:hypothetical protein